MFRNNGKFSLIIFILTLALQPLYANAGFGDSGGQSFIVTMLITVVVMIVVFLILREFFCWYWKINEIVSLLSDIKNRLSNNNSNNSDSTSNSTSEEYCKDNRQGYKKSISNETNITCLKCGAPVSAALRECDKCGSPIMA